MEIKILWSDDALDKLEEIFDYYQTKAGFIEVPKLERQSKKPLQYNQYKGIERIIGSPKTDLFT